MDSALMQSSSPPKKSTVKRLTNLRVAEPIRDGSVALISPVKTERLPESSSRTMKDMPLLPSPTKQAEEKYGSAPINELYRRVGDVSISHQARESIRRVLDSYQRSVKLLPLQPLVLPEIDVAGGNAQLNSPSHTNTKKHLLPETPTSASGPTSPVERRMKINPSPPIPPIISDSHQATQTQVPYKQDCLAHEEMQDKSPQQSSRSLNRRTNTRIHNPTASLRLSLDYVADDSSPDEFLCVPAGWSPSSLSYSMVEHASTVPPGTARARRKKIKVLSLQRQLQMEKEALSKNDKFLREKEDRQQKAQQQAMTQSHLKYMETTDQARAYDSMEEEYQKLLQEERKLCSMKTRRVNLELEAQKKERNKKEQVLYSLRLSESENERDFRDKLYREWEREAEEKKRRNLHRYQGADHRFEENRDRKINEIQTRMAMESARSREARERRAKNDETRPEYEYPEKLEKVEKNREKLRQELEERMKQEHDEHERKCKEALEFYQKTQNEKRERFEQRNISADESVMSARQRLREKAQKTAESNRHKKETTTNRKSHLSSQREAFLQEVAENVVDKALRVDVMRLEKEENERIMCGEKK